MSEGLIAGATHRARNLVNLYRRSGVRKETTQPKKRQNRKTYQPGGRKVLHQNLEHRSLLPTAETRILSLFADLDPPITKNDNSTRLRVAGGQVCISGHNLSPKKNPVLVYTELKLAERPVEKYKGLLQPTSLQKAKKKPGKHDDSTKSKKDCAYVTGEESECFLGSVESRAHEKMSSDVELQTDG
ncbi:hypothetical protein E4U32_005844 [Claviceps aff. humidiphila group G2b]|nr:hypothetical protein E4U32_005844 [Claviceps aff. humidiphila group G2b]